MDFKIYPSTRSGDMSWEPADDIGNNIWLSLNIRKGSFFVSPNFGNRLHLLKKNVPGALALAESYAMEALQWIVDIGRATSIEIKASRDMDSYPNRLILRGEAVQADGRRVSFSHFVEVV